MDEDTESLWRRVTQDVKPLSKRGQAKAAGLSNASHQKRPVEKLQKVPHGQSFPIGPADKVKGGRPIEQKSPQRRKASNKIEARLDLHGYTLSQAREFLTRKLLQWHADGVRSVLVITGQATDKKHKNDDHWWEGQVRRLRTEVPEWLAQPPLKGIILNFETAKQRDGGAGALYVRLRRDRDKI